jgi:hypothetical protein
MEINDINQCRNIFHIAPYEHKSIKVHWIISENPYVVIRSFSCRTSGSRSKEKNLIFLRIKPSIYRTFDLSENLTIERVWRRGRNGIH